MLQKPAYEQVIQRSKYHGDDCFGGGVDCGAFVYNAIVESGWDQIMAVAQAKQEKFKPGCAVPAHPPGKMSLVKSNQMPTPDQAM